MPTHLTGVRSRIHQPPPTNPEPEPDPGGGSDAGRKDPPTLNFVRFKNRTVELNGNRWLVEAGHHFEGEESEQWQRAWCYITKGNKGVSLKIDLAQRGGPSKSPTATIADLETLKEAGLTVPEAYVLASKCEWLDGTFTVTDLGSSPQIKNPFPPEKLQTSFSNRVLSVSGSIGVDFTDTIIRFDFDVLEIRSGGGLIVEALKAGRELRKRGKDVRVNETCLSACVLVLAGGQHREASTSARVGVHRFKGAQASEKDIEIGQALSSAITSYLAEMGISIDLFHAMAAVPSETIKYLPRNDMEKWQLLTDARTIMLPPDPAPEPAPQPHAKIEPKPLPNGRVEISSKAGWTLSFAPGIFALDPAVSDKFDDKEQTWDTYLRSVEHLPEAIAFIQVSINKSCRDPQRYVEGQIYPRRDPAQLTRSEPLGSETHASYVIEGRGVALSRSTFDQRGYFDWVAMRRGDQSTIVHVGGKFPAEHASLYREEIRKILRSLKLPEQDPFTKKCVS